MTVTNGLGIQSFCFRAFKEHEDVISKLKECGVSAIELCAAHADFSDSGSFDDIIGMYKSAGVDIVSIGVQGFADEEAKERLYFDFAKKAGARFMSVDFDINTFPACFRTAENLAGEYDMHLGIHNHGGRHWLGPVKMLEYVMANTNERIGLCLDTAWALDSSEDPVKMAEVLADRLYGVHLKDFVFGPDGKPEDVVVGTGNLDLEGLVEKMENADFDGYAVIEYEGDVDNPVPALKKCVEAINKTSIGTE
jgi:inosose dehydratase